MSICQRIKTAVDFAIFSATPSTSKGNLHEWKIDNPFKLENQLSFCQEELNKIRGNAKKIIDPKSKKKLHELKKKVKEKISILEKKLESSKKSTIKELEERISELKDSLKEIAVIEKTSTNYQFKVNSQKPELTYNDVMDTATVNYDGTMSGLLNELKHAFQYETGKIDFIRINDSSGKSSVQPGLTYDLQDELETYKRQYAYDGILKLKIVLTADEMMQELRSGKLKANLGLGFLEIKKMKKITANLIIRIGDSAAGNPLYEHISKKSLDINSPIGDIIKNNPARENWSKGLGLDKWDKEKPYIDFIKVFIEENPFIYVKF